MVPFVVFSGHDARFISNVLQLPTPRLSLRFTNDDEKLQQKTKFNVCNKRTSDYSRIGPNATDHEVHYCAKTLSNWRRGVVKRVAPQVVFQQNIRDDFFSFINNVIIPKLQIAPLIDNDTLLEDWLSKTRYNTKRKNLMRSLNASYFNRLHKFPDLFLQCKSFIKSEFYDTVKEPRIINSRSDHFKAIVGPYTHLVEKFVFNEHFIKHKTPEEIASIMSLISSKHSIMYETDYSSFEGSFSQEIMENVEFKMFQRILQNYPRIVELFRRTYHSNNVIKYQYHGKLRAKATFSGSRMSGDMWTSLANGFTNMCLVEYILAVNNQQKFYTTADYLVEGDDGFICTDKQLDWSRANQIGFSLKCEQCNDMNKLSFCGICSYDGLLVPDFRRIMNHYGYSHDRTSIRFLTNPSKNQKRKFLNMVHSRALSLLAQSRGIPILQAIAQQQLRFGGHFDPKYVDWWENETYDFSNVTAMTALPITDRMRNFFAQRYDIPIPYQLKLEKEINECQDICFDIDLPYWRLR